MIKIKPKVLVLGIDGGSIDLINKFSRMGELPNFDKIMKKGSFGKLKSTIPYMTYPAWKCYSTGLNPGKLGVYWFINLDKNNRKIYTNNAKSFRSKEIWDILGANDIKVGVINMPTNFPPKRVNGFMISGFEASNKAMYTYPSKLKIFLEKNYNYKVNPNKWISSHGEKALSEYEDIIKNRFKILNLLKTEVDFMHITIYLIDNIQHYYWDKPDILIHFYKIFDNELDKLIKYYDYIFIISDHGFTKLSNIFYINNWLEINKYLKRKENNKISVLKSKFNIDTFKKIRKKFNMLNYLIDIIPVDKIVMLNSLLSNNRKFGTIFQFVENIYDWENSKAIALENLIFVTNNDKKIIKLLKKELSKIVEPYNRNKLCKKIFDKNFYKGDCLSNAPDIIIEATEGFEIKTDIRADKSIWELDNKKKKTDRTGVHTREGMFFLMGKNVRSNYKVENADIFDIFPTILYLYNIKIEKDMIDGKIIKAFN